MCDRVVWRTRACWTRCCRTWWARSATRTRERPPTAGRPSTHSNTRDRSVLPPSLPSFSHSFRPSSFPFSFSSFISEFYFLWISNSYTSTIYMYIQNIETSYDRRYPIFSMPCTCLSFPSIAHLWKYADSKCECVECSRWRAWSRRTRRRSCSRRARRRATTPRWRGSRTSTSTTRRTTSSPLRSYAHLPSP